MKRSLILIALLLIVTVTALASVMLYGSTTDVIRNWPKAVDTRKTTEAEEPEEAETIPEEKPEPETAKETPPDEQATDGMENTVATPTAPEGSLKSVAVSGLCS